MTGAFELQMLVMSSGRVKWEEILRGTLWTVRDSVERVISDSVLS